MPSLARIVAAALMVAVSPMFARGQPGSPGRIDEYRLKAAVLYNLGRFVSWPPDAFPDATAPFTICVLGTDPFGARLDDVVQGHRIGERRIMTVRMPDVGPACHLVFIATSEQRRLPSIIGSLRGSRSLTVAESANFTTLGGMVGLHTNGDQIRLDINLAAAEAEQLKVSARLLALTSGRRRTAEGEP